MALTFLVPSILWFYLLVKNCVFCYSKCKNLSLKIIDIICQFYYCVCISFGGLWIIFCHITKGPVLKHIFIGIRFQLG